MDFAQKASEPGPWYTEFGRPYSGGRSFWMVRRYNPAAPLHREYICTRTAVKRFYKEQVAQAEADKLNAHATALVQGGEQPNSLHAHCALAGSDAVSKNDEPGVKP